MPNTTYPRRAMRLAGILGLNAWLGCAAPDREATLDGSAIADGFAISDGSAISDDPTISHANVDRLVRGANNNARTPGASTPVGHICTVEEVDRFRLNPVGDRYLYVEPQVFLPIDGGVLVAGQPTYEWSVDSEDRGALMASAQFFGVEIRGDSIALIPQPPHVEHPGWVRGLALGGGRFGFLFDEVDEESTAVGGVIRTLYAEYDDGVWSAVEELPVPTGGHVRTVANASSLVADAIGMERSVAMPFYKDRGGIDVLLFERDVFGWHSQVVFPDWIDQVDLTRTNGGTILALAGLDPEFASHLSSMRTLRLDRPGAPADQPLRVALGTPDDRYRDPTFGRSADHIELGWLLAGSQGPTSAWVADLGMWGWSGPRQIGASVVQIAAIGREGRSTLWASHAIDPATGADILGLSQSGPDGSVSTSRTQYPFIGPFAAVEISSDEILVIGPEARMESMHPFVRSLTIRLKIHCT